ncbi:HNH endonuclease [Methylobacterium currus]|uniref:HNH endonuclease n=1 Tax=Methylobacterium currus TaxID=2051553 RepID=A0A2R4WI52_9HYPH|nr:HNH endonuclease [Methylobacterium currus]AWB21197.1 HNH endonuclease [Methylobacterium currus]
MTDVGTTARKPLTPTQRLKLFERFSGVCQLCSRKIEAGEPWVDEHLRALSLGGGNEEANRAPVHKACADAKTYGPEGDLAKAAKAKRQKMAHLGIRSASKPIQGGQSLPGANPARRATKPLEKALPPRRGLFRSENA